MQSRYTTRMVRVPGEGTCSSHLLILVFIAWYGLANGLTDSKKTTKRDPLDRPNFVLFFVDDLGYGDCGFTGHPTTQTPNIDSLAWNGKILTTWYSACAVCSCSRASLLTGRQWPRTGVQEVFPRLARGGLPLNETTIAEQLRKQNYSSAIVGKWHLGQRLAYLPGNQGFDYYLGLPYSVDMGNAQYSTCPNEDFATFNDNPLDAKREKAIQKNCRKQALDFSARATKLSQASSNFTPAPPEDDDYAAYYIPLVYQEFNRTKILQQPVDFTTLAGHYVDFAQTYIERHQDQPFLLYVPFSHVHMTSGYTNTWEQRPNCQYADCQHQHKSPRGSFGDALAEVDWIVGRVMDSIRQYGLEENTLVVFTSDNGPWVGGGIDGGSAGVFTGRFAKYTSTAKGSTWEGGLREPAFAYWKGQIQPFSRSSETISSMDIFPTFSYLAGIPLPNTTTSASSTHDNNGARALKLDGRNMADILLRSNGKSQHDFLFFYGFCNGGWPHSNITAIRHGPYKVHFCTGPGGGSPADVIHYRPYPLMFQVDHDPSEAFPLSTGEMPSDPTHAAAMQRIMRAYAMEVATFEYGPVDPLPPGPGEGPGRYGLCCDRALNCSCTTSSSSSSSSSLMDHSSTITSSSRPWKRMGLFNVGRRAHHDRYHEIVGEVNHHMSTTKK